MRTRASCFSPVCHWGNSRSGRSLTDPPEHLVWTRMFCPTTAHIHHYIYTMTISLDLSAITGWVGCVSLSFQNTVCAPQGFHLEITLTPHLPVQVHPGLSPCWLPPVQFDEGFPVYPQVVIHPGFYPLFVFVPGKVRAFPIFSSWLRQIFNHILGLLIRHSSWTLTGFIRVWADIFSGEDCGSNTGGFPPWLMVGLSRVAVALGSAQLVGILNQYPLLSESSSDSEVSAFRFWACPLLALTQEFPCLRDDPEVGLTCRGGNPTGKSFTSNRRFLWR